MFNCNVYGDERDPILARWNLLQALWGTGKGKYSVFTFSNIIHACTLVYLNEPSEYKAGMQATTHKHSVSFHYTTFYTLSSLLLTDSSSNRVDTTESIVQIQGYWIQLQAFIRQCSGASGTHLQQERRRDQVCVTAYSNHA